MTSIFVHVAVWKLLSYDLMEMDESFSRIYSKYKLVSNNTAHVHLVPKLNYFMLLCKAAGLHIRWEWEFMLRVYRYVPSGERVNYRVSFDVALTELNVKHLRAAFIFWFFGISLAILGFVLERIIIIYIEISYFI